LGTDFREASWRVDSGPMMNWSAFSGALGSTSG